MSKREWRSKQCIGKCASVSLNPQQHVKFRVYQQTIDVKTGKHISSVHVKEFVLILFGSQFNLITHISR